MNKKKASRIGMKISGAAAAAAAAGVLFLSMGCGGAEKEKEPIVNVLVTPAEKGAISQQVSSEAVVYPVEQATIAPKITSTITEFKVNRGSRVKKGELLAVLENRDLTATADATKGDLEQADAQYNLTVNSSLPQQIQKAQGDAAAAKASYDAAEKVYEARKSLFEQGAIPRRDLDSAEVAMVQGKAQNEQAQKQLADLERLGEKQNLKAAQGALSSTKGKYEAAAAQLSYSEIHSPIDGVVTDRPLYVGDVAVANQPLLTVMNLSRLIAKAHIPQSESATLKVGDPAEVKLPGVDKPVAARVTLVSPALDPGSTTVEVWVEARRPDPALRPGMAVEVSMTAKAAKDALVVPTPAVYKNDAGASYVLIAGSDEKAHQKVIEVGIHNSELTQVVSGINPGDPVITSGGYAVPDGTAIKVAKPGEEGESADKDEKDEKGGKADKAGDKDDKKDDKADAKPAPKDKE